MDSHPTPNERSRRWRLILGSASEDPASGFSQILSQADLGMDRALQALYESDRKGGLGSSCPNVARWLGDIRQYFPTSVVQVMQKDALERLDLKQMLFEPELLPGVFDRLTGRGPAGGSALTARERETLDLLAEGATTEEIGRRLGVSRNTTRNHVQRVLEKLGARSKLEAVAVARREGLIG